MNGSKMEDLQTARKRGRPTGKNRVPLSAEERRARNAQYERERRDGTAEAMRLLAEAAGCSPNTPNKMILCAAHDLITSFEGTIEEVALLRRTNESMMAEVEKLKNILARVALGEKGKKHKNKNKDKSCKSTKHDKEKSTSKKSTKRHKHKSTNAEQIVVPLEPIIDEGDGPMVSSEFDPVPNIPVYDDWVDPYSLDLHDPLTGAALPLEEPFSAEGFIGEIDPWPESSDQYQGSVEIDPAELFSYGNENTLSTAGIENRGILGLNIRSV